MDKILVREVQRFEQLWIRIPLYLLAISNILIFGNGIYRQLILGQPWGNQHISNEALIIVTLITLFIWTGLIWLIEKAQLVTEFDETGIRLRFPPFFRKFKHFPVKSIDSMEIRKYNPILEYGGWGIRMGFRGKAYNVRGNIGLQLHFKNGKKLLIGTQKPEQVQWAIRKMMLENKKNL